MVIFTKQNKLKLFVKEDDPDPFHIIPELVIFMCLLFYEMDEFFDKQNPSKIKISGNCNHILTKLDQIGIIDECYTTTIYGHRWINSMDNIKVI